MNPAQALQLAYERAVQRALSDDPAQRQVLARLGRLADCLHAKPPDSSLRRWFYSRWPERFGLQPCRGIYIWGGVGRGKTWLMDLFCDQLAPGEVQRLPYQHLMREVHRQLALRLGKSQERPLRKVAA